MNNSVVFAAAGNGKTYSTCKEAIALADGVEKGIIKTIYLSEEVNGAYGTSDKLVVYNISK